MTGTRQFAETTVSASMLGIPRFEEPGIVQYQDSVWSCGERREVPARLRYAVSRERGYNVYRLLSIQPLL